jgi:hypothetical protein
MNGKYWKSTHAFFLAFYKAPVLSQQLALAGCVYSIFYTEQWKTKGEVCKVQWSTSEAKCVCKQAEWQVDGETWQVKSQGNCKDTKSKIRKKISQKRNCSILRPQSQFLNSCVCERFIYSHDRSVYSAAGKHVDRSRGYVIRSQAHECGNWAWGRAISFQGIQKWKFGRSRSEWWRKYTSRVTG